MRPILFTIGGVPVASWYLFFALGGIAAYCLAAWLLARAARASSEGARAAEGFGSLFALCYVAGWFGARAFSLWREQTDVQGFVPSLEALFSMGPMTFYGGALVAFGVGLAWIRARRLPTGLLADACLPAASLGLAFGRVGCHLNGDDFGLPVANQVSPPAWAVAFPNLADGVARYPVQLAEAGASGLIAALGSWAFLRVHTPRGTSSWPARPGAVAAAVAVASTAQRFANEVYRGDPRGSFWGTSLSTSQGIAILVFFTGIFLLALLVRVPERNRAISPMPPGGPS
jgi:phosphatidylglycerol:prolipoprotein diacylglycerol transferase